GASTACATARRPIASSPPTAPRKSRAAPTTNRKWEPFTTCSSRNGRQTYAPGSTNIRLRVWKRAFCSRTEGEKMHGDFTRNTFDPTRHYSRVLMQQGRIALDADWNEQTSILLHYLRTLACDVFGPHAGPADHLGFEIIGNLTDPSLETRLKALIPRDADRRKAVKDGIIDGDVLIAPGRYYVDGLLAENH